MIAVAPYTHTEKDIVEEERIGKKGANQSATGIKG